MPHWALTSKQFHTQNAEEALEEIHVAAQNIESSFEYQKEYYSPSSVMAIDEQIEQLELALAEFKENWKKLQKKD